MFGGVAVLAPWLLLADACGEHAPLVGALGSAASAVHGVLGAAAAFARLPAVDAWPQRMGPDGNGRRCDAARTAPVRGRPSVGRDSAKGLTDAGAGGLTARMAGEA